MVIDRDDRGRPVASVGGTTKLRTVCIGQSCWLMYHSTRDGHAASDDGRAICQAGLVAGEWLGGARLIAGVVRPARCKTQTVLISVRFLSESAGNTGGSEAKYSITALQRNTHSGKRAD